MGFRRGKGSNSDKQMKLAELATNQFVLLFVAIATGLLLGRVRIGRFSLGSSGIIITGLLIGWVVQKYIVIPGSLLTPPAQYAIKYLERGAVSSEIFNFSLIIFIAAVGLLAAKELGTVFKRYGAALITLGILVPLFGAAASFFLCPLAGISNQWTISGIFTGALTSSPGLASALENAARTGSDAQAQVGYGYALGYSSGVIAVILFVQLVPALLRINVEKERERITSFVQTSVPREHHEQTSVPPKLTDTGGNSLGLVPFAIVCIVGMAIGSLTARIGSIGELGLGVTGGVLLSSLFFGAIGKIGVINFRESAAILSSRKDLGLSLFLGVVGLKYGYITIHTLSGDGLVIMFLSFFIALIAIIAGFVIGRYVFKLDWIILVGSLCGAMTSTPGLGAAVDSTGSDLVTVGYGASYPIALFGMVIFTVLLQILPGF